MDRSADARIGAAAAEIGAHGAVDLLICRLRVNVEKTRCLHDLPGLAVAALGDLVFDPGFLHGVQRVGGSQPFDGGDFGAFGLGNRHLAGADCQAVDMDGTGTALCYAASVFGAGDAEFVAQDPKKGHVGFDVDLMNGIVDAQFHDSLPAIILDKITKNVSVSTMSDISFDQLDQRRAAVLKAALEVFTSYGYRRTTMDDIARAAGMSRPALYTHFRNKEAIFRTFVEMFLGAIVQDAQAVLAAKTSVADGLEAFFDAAFVAPFRELMATQHGMELAGVNAELCGDLTEQWFADLETVLRDWLDKAVAEGRLKLGGLRSAALARLLIDAVEGIKSRGGDKGHHADPEAMTAEMTLLAQMAARAYGARA